MIYAKYIEDSRGDLVDVELYHAHCAPDDAVEVLLCDHETDSPIYCPTCVEPVGNPLTSDGMAYAEEMVHERVDGWKALADIYDIDADD